VIKQVKCETVRNTMRAGRNPGGVKASAQRQRGLRWWGAQSPAPFALDLPRVAECFFSLNALRVSRAHASCASAGCA
jgi:hypothetical protein